MGYSVLIHWLLSLSSCQSSVDMRYLKDSAQELSIRGGRVFKDSFTGYCLSSCKSSVGMRYWRDGVQELSLGGGCNAKGTIMHEMMHALGFWHEQSRPDRNQFVEILWENIEPGVLRFKYRSTFFLSIFI